MLSIHYVGWGTSLRNAIANWYLSKDANSLAYQAVKYHTKKWWSHKDFSRPIFMRKSKAHPRQKQYFRIYVFREQLSTSEGKVRGQREFSKSYRILDHIGHADFSKILVGYWMQSMKPIRQAGINLIAGVLVDTWGDSQWGQAFSTKSWGCCCLQICQWQQWSRIGQRWPRLDIMLAQLPIPMLSLRMVCERLVDKARLINQGWHPITNGWGIKVYQSGHGVKEVWVGVLFNQYVML